MSYTLLLSPSAKRDLEKLPLRIQKDIVFKHFPKIQSNPYNKGIPLAGAFKAEKSYHFGRRPEYRIIYFIENNVITITIIGTREGIYRTAKKRH